MDGDPDFVKVDFEDLSDDELGKCCHTCANCTSDEEEYLICIYDSINSKSKSYSDT